MRPPKITVLNPMRAGIEVDEDGNVAMAFFFPTEMYEVHVSGDAWKAMNDEVAKKSSGIAVVRTPEIVLPS